MRLTRLLLVLLVPLSTVASEPRLDQLLTEDEQAAVGVATMKPAQKDALRRALIDMYLLGLEKGKQQGGLQGGGEAAGGVIESKIEGEFEGWDGDTVVKLVNGQVWKQIEYRYEYRYAFMPKALIYRSGSGYKMKVDGTREAVGVMRLQ